MRRAVVHKLVFALAAVSGLLAAGGCQGRAFNPNLHLERFLPNVSRRPTVVFAQTNDGKILALERIEPNQINPDIPPLLFVHSEGFNRNFWTAAAERSIVRFFSNYGFDIWLLDLRGHGDSTKPEWYNDADWNWTFDEYVHKDIPAAVSFVQGQTRSRQVTLVGHGTGGMAIYGYLELENFFDEVANAVVFGSPAFFSEIDPSAAKLVKMAREMEKNQPLVNTFALEDARNLALFKEIYTEGSFVKESIVRRLGLTGVDDVSPSVVQQMLRWATLEDFLSSDLQLSYRVKMGLIRVPMLIVAGNKDRFAPLGAVNYGFRSLTVKDKALLVFGKEFGYIHDYSNLGLVQGDGSWDEVFPVVFEWLEARTPALQAWGKF